MRLTPRNRGLALRPLSVLVGSAALVATALAAPADAAGSPSSSVASAVAAVDSERAIAERSLARVERLFAGRGAGRDTTLALRDLALTQDSLAPADRALAARYLARPTDSGDDDPEAPQYGTSAVGNHCGAHLCLHWVETGEHAVADDGNPGTVPAYVSETLGSLEEVAAAYVRAGYRPVKGDGALGGNAKPDVYLADVGPAGLYGYCTTDQDTDLSTGPYDVWAFCVLDDDYSDDEFDDANTPVERMQVTAAHEYFHAVQFGYDVWEDRWLMEATATWAEDELYDDVDDNLQYLSASPLAHPEVPLDYFGQGHHYGDWIFFRYLTENVVDEVDGGMPVLVREIWERLDAAPGRPDHYSTGGLQATLAAHGLDLRSVFAQFADGNRRPHLTYDEATDNAYPEAPGGTFTQQSGWYTTRLDHLSSASLAYNTAGRKRKLVLSVDMAPTSRGSAAVATVYYRSGSVAPRRVPLDAQGNGTLTLPFAKSSVLGVDVTLVNASTNYRCGVDANSPFSCYGYSLDDDLVAKVRAVAKR